MLRPETIPPRQRSLPLLESGANDPVGIALLVNQALIAARGNTILKAGDQLLITGDDRRHPLLKRLFDP